MITNSYTETNKSQIGTSKAWLISMIGAFYFFYLFIQITKFNAIGTEVMRDFNIGPAGLGVLSSMYFWGNVLFLFPAGLLLDRFSTKKILAICMIVVIICTALFSRANTILQASLLSAIIGVAGSFALLLPLRLASRWFSSEKMALVSGLIITIGFCGALIGQSPLVIITSIFGWRSAMFMNACFGVILFVVMMIIIKDFPHGMQLEKSSDSGIKSLVNSLRESIVNRQNWLFGLYTCFLNLPVFVLGAAFGIHYLEAQGLSTEQGAFAASVLFIGAMIGSPVLGLVSDKMKLRKLPMMISAIISLILILMLMYTNHISAMYSSILFFLIGFFTSAQVISYPVIGESNKSSILATSLGMASVLIMSGGSLGMPLFGWLLGIHATDSAICQYQFALWMIPIAFVLGIVAIIFGKETRCKSIV